MLKLIIWLFAIYIFFKLFNKYLFPLVLKYYIKQFQKKFYSNYNSNFDINKTKRKIHISRLNNKSGKFNSDFGEYVDFEEINNDNK